MGKSEIFSLNLPAFLRIPIEYLLGIFSLRKIYNASILRNVNIYDAIIDVMNACHQVQIKKFSLAFQPLETSSPGSP